MSAAVVILAGGSGSRVGASVNKALLPLGTSTVVGMSLQAALHATGVRRIVLVHRAGEAEAMTDAVLPILGAGEVSLVEGGSTRHGSEWQALRVLRAEIESGEITAVAIHDAARPLASAQLFDLTLALTEEFGGAIPAAPVTALISRDLSTSYTGLGGVQTPQAFRARDLLAAYDQADRDGFEGTDTAATLARYAQVRIAAVPSPSLNLKVTFPEDVSTVSALLSR